MKREVNVRTFLEIVLSVITLSHAVTEERDIGMQYFGTEQHHISKFSLFIISRSVELGYP